MQTCELARFQVFSSVSTEPFFSFVCLSLLSQFGVCGVFTASQLRQGSHRIEASYLPPR